MNLKSPDKLMYLCDPFLPLHTNVKGKHIFTFIVDQSSHKNTVMQDIEIKISLICHNVGCSKIELSFEL